MFQGLKKEKPQIKQPNSVPMRGQATILTDILQRHAPPSTKTEARTLWNLRMQTHICTQYENFETELCKHLRACALKPFSLHFFNPSFGLTNLDGRLLRLPVDTVTVLTLGSTVEGICVHLHVKPLSGPGNLAADEPQEHSESCTTPFHNSKVALQHALHQL